MRSNRLLRFAAPLLWLSWFVILSGCSSTAHLPAGEYLYIGRGKTKIVAEDDTKESAEAIAKAEAYTNVPPNGALLMSPRYRLPIQPGLWVHNSFAQDSSWLGKKIYSMFATEPVLLSGVNTQVRAQLASNALKEHGYFRAVVTDSIAFSQWDTLQAKAFYTMDLGKPFHYDSIAYLPAWSLPDGGVYNHAEVSAIKRGNQFNLAAIQADRQAISSYLREHGHYYFSPDVLSYEIDTIAHSGAAAMRVRLKETVRDRVIYPWKIGNVKVSLRGAEGNELQDSLSLEGVKIYFNGSLPVRPMVLARRIFLKSGSFYSQTNEQNTLQALSRLGAFSSTNLLLTPADTINHLLDLHILSDIDKPWDASLEALVKLKSNNFMGPGLSLSASRRNAFGGGERLSMSLWGSYEWQHLKNIFNTRSGLNSYELGTDLSLATPSILLPGLSDELYPFPTTTDFTLSASMLHRARYFRMLSLGFSATYMFNRWMKHKHTITPFRLKYSLLSHRTEEFDEILEKNAVLGLSFQNQFIPEVAYTYTFDDIFEDKGSHHLWMEYSLSEAGNLINLLYTLSGKDYNTSKEFLGIPFAQFIRTTGDIHYTYEINPQQTLAARLAWGAIFSYGNSTVAPYREQFFVGGANSIRAFSIRSIGPGRYIPSGDQYAFMDQVGDFKLEANLEWRFRLWGGLYGALFVDTGNIWLLREDSDREGGALSEIRGIPDFFNQLALGSGVGVRYDLGLIVIRGDLGVGLHLPYATERRGYFNLPSLGDALNFHFAIGYPF